MSEKDPKIEAALAEARMRAEMARNKYPVLNPEGPQGPGRPPQPPGTPAPPPMAPGRQPTTVGHVSPAPGVPLPGPAPVVSGGLQTASFDALLREVDRRKMAALERLQKHSVAVEALEMELKLRQLPAAALEVLREIPTSILEDEIDRIRGEEMHDAGI